MEKRKTLYTTPAQAKEVQRLTKDECSNLDDGKYCLLLDGLYCPVLTTSSYVSCNFFRDSILPGHPELEKSIIEGMPFEQKVIYHNCRDCGKSFTATAKNSLYCDSCKKSHRKETKRKSNSKRVEKDKVNSAKWLLSRVVNREF